MLKDKPITGSVQEQRGKYFAVLNLYVDGRRKQKWKYTGYTTKDGKRRAVEFLQNLLSELNAHRVYPLNDFSCNLEFVAYLRSWLQTKKPVIAPSTYMGYEYSVEGKIHEYFSPFCLALHQIKATTIYDFYQYLYDQGLSCRTVLHYHRILKQALSHAVMLEIINRNIMDNVAAPPDTGFIPTTYNYEESLELLWAAKDTSIFIPVLLGLVYGMRRSEIVGLQWKSIDFERGVLTIENKVVFGQENGRKHIYESKILKTSTCRRSLPLVPFVKAELENELKEQQARRQNSRRAYQDNCEYVCACSDGRRMYPNYITKEFQKLLKSNGLKCVRFHDLRHTNASLLAINDVSLQRIQHWLGHSDFRTTAKYYAHLDDSANEKSAETVDKLFMLGLLEQGG